MTLKTSIEDIEKQEDDIFKLFGDENSTDLHESFLRLAKSKQLARQQLTVSIDSPFNLGSDQAEAELRRMRDERADLLDRETREIRRQLEYVKSRLNSLKSADQNDDLKEIEKISQELPVPQDSISQDVGATKSFKDRQPSRLDISSRSEPKLRPLTGKTDCPNCNCDRRSSICDRCSRDANPTQPSNSKAPTMSRQASNLMYNHDERPIRPLRDKIRATVETVDEVVVPGRIYAISRSLNDKRTKLATAIEELQLMIDKVKARGEKLDKERRVVQLYKDQWRYGPNIGGQMGSSREKLGPSTLKQPRSYESRLDANLARDTKSLLGFQDINSSLRLRNYGSNKMTTNSIRQRVPNQTKKSVAAPRSKSLESLHSKSSSKPAKTNVHQSKDNFERGKSSSEINLTSQTELNTNVNRNIEVKSGKEDEGEEAEEEFEVIVVDDDEKSEDKTGQNTNDDLARARSPIKPTNGSDPHADKPLEPKAQVQRLSWVPVFGETEVKTTRRNSRQRKVTIVEAQGSKSQTLRSGLVSAPRVPASRRTPSGKSAGLPATDKTLIEARRQLKSATDLLDTERQDSRTRNQLVINKFTPKPTQAKGISLQHPTQSKKISTDEPKVDVTADKTETDDSRRKNNEIARLEEMINEQQKLLIRLVENNRDRIVVSPVTVRCSSPCSSHQSSPTRRSVSPSVRSTPSNMIGSTRSLVNSLRDKLNKTKLRLAKTLEEERRKHEQLKQKVDSSLRKQSDLESENEILKQSLSRCIDTCLKDILSTFESLSDSLASQAGISDRRESAIQDHRPISADVAFDLTNAAQFISDNRHVKQMQSHIETIERQRKGIFEELGKEKSRSRQLESQLTENQAELSRLMEAKAKLELQLESMNRERVQLNHSSPLGPQARSDQLNPGISTSPPHNSAPIEDSGLSEANRMSSSNNASTSQTAVLSNNKSKSEDTQNSIEMYRRYIDSISPDIETIRRERKLILNEFDEIKKMLTTVDLSRTDQ